MSNVEYDIVEGMDARDVRENMKKKTRNGWFPTGWIAINSGTMGSRFYQAIYRPLEEKTRK